MNTRGVVIRLDGSHLRLYFIDQLTLNKNETICVTGATPVALPDDVKVVIENEIELARAKVQVIATHYQKDKGAFSIVLRNLDHKRAANLPPYFFLEMMCVKRVSIFEALARTTVREGGQMDVDFEKLATVAEELVI